MTVSSISFFSSLEKLTLKKSIIFSAVVYKDFFKYKMPSSGCFLKMLRTSKNFNPEIKSNFESLKRNEQYNDTVRKLEKM